MGYTITDFLKEVDVRNQVVDQNTRKIWETSELVSAVVAAPDATTELHVEELLAAALAGVVKMKFKELPLKDGCTTMLLTGDIISATDLIYRPAIAANPNDTSILDGNTDDDDEEPDDAELKRVREEAKAKVVKARKQAVKAFGGNTAVHDASKLPAGDAKPAPRRRMTHAERCNAKASARKKK
jgi:hypothetical protein